MCVEEMANFFLKFQHQFRGGESLESILKHESLRR